jgi:hypothetical protein
MVQRLFNEIRRVIPALLILIPLWAMFGFGLQDGMKPPVDTLLLKLLLVTTGALLGHVLGKWTISTKVNWSEPPTAAAWGRIVFYFVCTYALSMGA